MSASVMSVNNVPLEFSAPINVVTSTGTGTSPPAGPTGSGAPGSGTGSGGTTGATASYVLLTSIAGTGSGSISPGSLGTSYPSGTAVTLTATAASGSAFAGWSGGCSGTSFTCHLTMIADTSVTATFTPLVRVGAVLSTAQSTTESFLRFYNAGLTAGTATVTLSDSISGTVLATWTTPSIPAGAAPQYSIASVESAATTAFTKPKYYAVQIAPQFAGSFQYVLWDVTQGVLTNQSTCNTSSGTVPTRLTNVHSSSLGDAGYPSTVVVSNTGTAATTAALSVFSATTGTLLGTYVTAQIAANGQIFVPVAQIEGNLDLSRATIAGTPHYVIKASSDFTGYLQNLVTNKSVGLDTDLTAVCALAAQN
jgi:hypothetical protein